MQNGPTGVSFKHCLVKQRALRKIYKDKLVDARGLSHHRNKIQSWAHWDDWVIGMMSKNEGGQTDRQTAFQLYIVD